MRSGTPIRSRKSRTPSLLKSVIQVFLSLSSVAIFSAEELPQVLGGLQPLDVRHPVGMLAGVEPLAAARRRADVGDAVGVHVDRQRVGDQLSRRPDIHLEAVGQLNGRGLPGLLGGLAGLGAHRVARPRRPSSAAVWGLHRDGHRQADDGRQGETGERHPARSFESCDASCVNSWSDIITMPLHGCTSGLVSVARLGPLRDPAWSGTSW